MKHIQDISSINDIIIIPPSEKETVIRFVTLTQFPVTVEIETVDEDQADEQSQDSQSSSL